MIIAESFDRRTLAAMEVALDRACESLGFAREQHDARQHIASKILECALRGERTLGALTEAGCDHPTVLDALSEPISQVAGVVASK
jgi:hypothetical protein